MLSAKGLPALSPARFPFKNALLEAHCKQYYSSTIRLSKSLSALHNLTKKSRDPVSIHNNTIGYKNKY